MAIRIRYELLPRDAKYSVNGTNVYPVLLGGYDRGNVRDRTLELRYVPQAPGSHEVEIREWYDEVIWRRDVSFDVK